MAKRRRKTPTTNKHITSRHFTFTRGGASPLVLTDQQDQTRLEDWDSSPSKDSSSTESELELEEERDLFTVVRLWVSQRIKVSLV